MKQRKITSLVFLGCAFLGVASAELVPIVNASFETRPSGFPTNVCGGTCAYTQGGIPIPGWNATGVGYGQVIMGGYQGNPDATDGLVMAYSQGGTITQDVGPAVGGTTYLLSVDIMHRTDAAFTGSISLLIGGVTVGTSSGTDPGAGKWGTFTDAYTASGADDGKTITIQLSSSGSQGDFDNVTLNATPEPATVVLFCSAFAGMALFRRRLVG